MIYFLFGPDTYRSRQKLKELTQTEGKNLNVQRVAAEDLSLNELKKYLSTSTLFAQTRFLIIEGLVNKSLKNKEEILKFLNALEFPYGEILIFWQAGVDRRSAIFKLLSKKADEQYEFNLLKPEEMEVWLRRQANELGLQLNQENRKKLAAMFGGDTWLAANELQKLKAYKNNQAIEYADIDLLVRGRLDDDIFKFTDYVAKKEKKQALDLLHNQLELGNHEIYLLTMVVRQFRILIQIKSVLSSNTSRAHYDLAKELGLHPFVVQKSLTIVQHYSLDELRQIYRKLLQIDLKIKTSRLSGTALLEKFILEI